jgi:5S rRNA maturation endonuclease (ribonuclease M5)
MPTSLERRLESFYQLLDKLKKEAGRGVPVIVEGKNDAEALAKMGIGGKTLFVKSTGRTILETIEQLSVYSEVIILTDFDRRGMEMERRISRQLQERRIKSNTAFWRELKGLIGRDVKDIEGLPAYIEGLRQKLRNNPYDP